MTESGPDPSAPVIRTRGLTKTFRDFWGRPKARALAGVNLSVARGEVFGLLGPNGSGKSTLLKLLVGLLHPSDGEVQVLDRPPRNVAVKQRVGYLPEESYFYSGLTAWETLDFYGQLFGLPRGPRQARARELLAQVGLAHAADRRVGEFSKGMSRRLGIAQALINDPEVLILDEPTSGLDPLGCRQMKDLLLQLARRGTAVLLSSHLLADVQDVCDRIAVLYLGRVLAEGQLRDLLTKRDEWRLILPRLDKEALRRAVEAVRSAAAVEPVIEHPTLTLEQFFLQVIAEADRTPDGAPNPPLCA